MIHTWSFEVVIVYLTYKDQYGVGVVGEMDAGQTCFLAVLVGPCFYAYGDGRVTFAGFWGHCQPFGAVEGLPGLSGSQVDVEGASAEGVAYALSVHAQAGVLSVFVAAGDGHRSSRYDRSRQNQFVHST